MEPDDFRCIIPECNETSENHGTVMEFGNSIFGRDDDGNIDYCKRYPIKGDPKDVRQCSSKNNFNLSASNDELVTCTPDQDIIYGEFGMDYTVVTRFNEVCEDQYKVSGNSHIHILTLLF